MQAIFRRAVLPLLAITIAACEPMGSMELSAATTPCNQDATLTTESSKIACYWEKQRPLVQQHYPLIEKDFVAYYEKAGRLAKDLDAKKISKQAYDVALESAKAPLNQSLNNYEDVVSEKKKQDYCASIGAPMGSPNYYDCRKTVAQEERRKDEAVMKFFQTQQAQRLQQQQIQENTYQQQQMINAINGLQSPSQPLHTIQQTNCRPDYSGGISCTTY